MLEGVRHEARQAFRSLESRPYRRFFFTNSFSMVGTWMELVGLSWLVYELTESGTALGVAILLQTIPSLLLGPIAGVWVERWDARRVLVVGQVVSASAALLLGLLTVTGVVELWMLYANALLLGTVMAVTQPAYSVFMFQMVDRDLLSNAVNLNLMQFNLARIVGPSVAGATIALIGSGPCFLLNAASFVGVIYVLATLRPDELLPREIQERAKGQLIEGFRYILGDRELAGGVVMLALFGVFVWEYEVTLPLLAEDTFAGGGGVYGLLTASIGVGAVVGAALAARETEPTHRHQLIGALVTGVGMVVAGLAPTLLVAYAGLAVAGAGLTAWYGILTAKFQLRASMAMQARCMAIWGTALAGARPVGGPVVGALGEQFGGRAGVLVGGIALFVLVVPAWGIITGQGVVRTLLGRGGSGRDEPGSAPDLLAPQPGITPLRDTLALTD